MDGSHWELRGLGHDLQLISELEEASALLAPDVFFTSGELRRFASSAVPRESLVGGWAAKEALSKALPAMTETWFWTDAELIPDQHGAPAFRTQGALARHLARHHLSVSVSITHSGGFASAVVVVTGAASAGTPFTRTIKRAVRDVLRRIPAHAASTAQ
jgi:holo-[acyl-carrier protein] synthase